MDIDFDRARLLHRLRRFTPSVNIICYGGTVFFTVMYILSSMAEDGLSFFDVLSGLVTGIVMLTLLLGLAQIGGKFIPSMHPKWRGTAFGVWLALALTVTVVATTTSAAHLAYPIAQTAQERRAAEEAAKQAASVLTAMSDAEAVLANLETAIGSAESMARDEARTGAISGEGSGVGRTAAELRAVLEALRGSAEGLIRARATASRVKPRLSETTDQIERLLDDREMKPSERVTALRAAFEAHGRLLEEIQNALPTEVLAQAADVLGRDWRAAGLNAVASARMEAAFRPVADRLRDQLGPMRAAAEREPVTLAETEAFQLIWDEIGATLPILLFCGLIDGVPVGLVIITYIAHLPTRRDEPADDDWLDGGSPPRSLPRFPERATPPMAAE